MSRRRKAREIALQTLYAEEISHEGWEKALSDTIERRKSSDEAVRYAKRLVTAVVENRDGLDSLIAGCLENWTLDRVSKIDLIILRIALAELLDCPDVPTSVIINEAIEIARRFSSRDAGRFVNGILDSLAREVRAI
jgi:N utilization substance protein B